ncbi:MAG: hypothetical protein LBD48_03570 [Treponema sp.]|nr:hypothetical protein [Treponema sp.]
MKNNLCIVLASLICLFFAVGCAFDDNSQFVSTQDRSVLNNEETLGLTGSHIDSTNHSIVTAVIEGDRIVVASAAAGTALIRIWDVYPQAAAEIAVSVEKTGKIKITGIEKVTGAEIEFYRLVRKRDGELKDFQIPALPMVYYVNIYGPGGGPSEERALDEKITEVITAPKWEERAVESSYRYGYVLRKKGKLLFSFPREVPEEYLYEPSWFGFSGWSEGLKVDYPLFHDITRGAVGFHEVLIPLQDHARSPLVLKKDVFDIGKIDLVYASNDGQIDGRALSKGWNLIDLNSANPVPLQTVQNEYRWYPAASYIYYAPWGINSLGSAD